MGAKARKRLAGLLAALVSVLVFARAEAQEPDQPKPSLIGCWEHDTYVEKPDATHEQGLVGFNLVCFNDEGVMTGMTYADRDAWEWDASYTLKDGQIIVPYAEYSGSRLTRFEYVPWGQIIELGAAQLTIDFEGRLRTYQLVCRTVQQDIQCERLTYPAPQ